MRFRRSSLAAISLQSAFRGFRVCRNFTALRWAALSLQRIFRGLFARRRVRMMRMTAASLLLQRFVRSASARKKYLKLRKAVVLLQSLWRHKVAVEVLFELRKQKMILLLQSAWRMWIYRKRFRKFLSSVVALQNRLRKGKAVRLLRQLRMEAKDLGKLKQSNDLLKQEIELIKQRAAEEKERLRKQLEEQARQDFVHGKDAEIELLRKRVEEHMMLLESERRLKLSLEQKLQTLNDTPPAVCGNCSKLRQELKDRESIINKLQFSISRDQRQLLSEEELQDILSTKSILEQENSRLRKQFVEQQVLLDNLQAQLERVHRPSSPSQQDPASRVGSFHSPRMREHADHIDRSATRKQEDSGVRKTGPPELVAAPDPLDNSLRDAEKKTSVWKAELRQGFRVLLWESSKSNGVEVVAKLDPTGRILQFLVTHRRTFSFLQSKSDVIPLRIIDIEQCSPGSCFKIDGLNPATALTIHSATRRIVLQFNSTDERSTTLSKLRAIVSSEQWAENSSQQQDPRSAVENLSGLMNENALVPSSSHAHRATRRLSIRETILEGNLANNSAPTIGKLTNPYPSEQSKSLRELWEELKAEREQKEKLKLQVLLASNELAEKDELIAKLRNRESTFEHQLQEKDRLYKQDMMVRLQLGKRLEQVLFDKEEALEELEQLKIQLDNIKSTLK